MQTKIYKFSDMIEAQYFLNGGIIGVDVSQGIYGLVGQALTFSSPAVFTVNFVAAVPNPAGRDPYKLLLVDIKAQIEAANPDISVQSIGGRIVLIEKLPSLGVAFDGTVQFSKTVLGLDNGVTVGKVYHPAGISGGPPNYTWVYSVNEGTHVVVTWE